MLKFSSLPLKRLGFTVLCIPLFCQIIFSTILYWQVQNAEHAVKNEIAAQAYTITLQKLVTALMERFFALRLERSTNISSTLIAEANTSTNLEQTVQSLFQYKDLTSSSRTRLQRVLAQQTEIEQGMRVLSFTVQDKVHNVRIQEAISQVFSDLKMVAKEVVENSRQSSGTTISAIASVKQILFSALIISSIGGIFLAWLVGQLAAQPISHILYNARAMAQRRSLLPLSSGPHELMAIDSALLRIAQTLADASARQHNLYELSPAFLLELSGNGKIIKGNQTVSSWLDKSMGDLTGENFFKFFEGAYRLRLESQFELARDSCSRKLFQLDAHDLFNMPDHTQWTVNWNEQSQSYFCVAHNITDSTNVERLRDQISRYLTLELGSPLKTIASLIAQAKQINANKPAEDPWTTKQLLVISHNVERLSNLLNQLDQSTDPTKLEIAVAQGICSNKTVISRSIEAVKSLAQARGVQIMGKVEWAMVRGTESELERVLINLISNAIKFTPENSRIDVSSRPQTGLQSDMVLFCVLDQGSGIPAQAREEIFSPFKQLENSKLNNTPSTGLGLSVCKTIVERAGGKIWVENAPTSGAAFNFLLPAGTGGGERLLD